MEKACARISEMPNRCILVVESSGGTRYSNIEEEIGYFGVLPEYAPVPSILTPPFPEILPKQRFCELLPMHRHRPSIERVAAAGG